MKLQSFLYVFDFYCSLEDERQHVTDLKRDIEGAGSPYFGRINTYSSKPITTCLYWVSESDNSSLFFNLSRYSGFSRNDLLYAMLVNLSASLFLSLGIHFI